jgi:hypothetical protein
MMHRLFLHSKSIGGVTASAVCQDIQACEPKYRDSKRLPLILAVMEDEDEDEQVLSVFLNSSNNSGPTGSKSSMGFLFCPLLYKYHDGLKIDMVTNQTVPNDENLTDRYFLQWNFTLAVYKYSSFIIHYTSKRDTHHPPSSPLPRHSSQPPSPSTSSSPSPPSPLQTLRDHSDSASKTTYSYLLSPTQHLSQHLYTHP